jgi:hypothetical protein
LALIQALRLMLQALLGLLLMLTGLLFPSRSTAILTIQGPITITNAGAGGAAIALNPGADGSSLVGITVSDNAGVGISIGNVSSVVLDGVTVDKNNVGISAYGTAARHGITDPRTAASCAYNTGPGVYINGSFTTH